ncbi:MAG: dihydropteroate synthase [Candidatus Altiarchaeales archaeon]|nr:dihydropteroate synthase [Candidatus Altiarchaeales archaeon]
MTEIIGILNVTPDSFYDGGKHSLFDCAVSHAKKMIDDGAKIIDVGGESTRPGAQKTPEKEELNRVLPVIEKLTELNIPTSIDTYKLGVAEKAVSAGALMINDVTGFKDARMIELAAEHNTYACIMHMKGEPQNMQKNPTYHDVVGEVKEFLIRQADKAVDAGLNKKNIYIDPGIGFGKTLEHNLALLRNIGEFKETGYNLLVGHSRKSFLGRLLDISVKERLPATLGVTAYLALKKVDVVRVHDIAENRQVIDVVSAVSVK